MKTICAWCRRAIADDGCGGHDSHGICSECRKAEEAKIAAAGIGRKILFPSGKVQVTPRAMEFIGRKRILWMILLGRHCSGDWGILDASDAEANRAALEGGGRLLSIYKICGEKLMLITNAARSSTTICFLDDPCPKNRSTVSLEHKER